jgi:putative membrane protein
VRDGVLDPVIIGKITLVMTWNSVRPSVFPEIKANFAASAFITGSFIRRWTSLGRLIVEVWPDAMKPVAEGLPEAARAAPAPKLFEPEAEGPTRVYRWQQPYPNELDSIPISTQCFAIRVVPRAASDVTISTGSGKNSCPRLNRRKGPAMTASPPSDFPAQPLPDGSDEIVPTAHRRVERTRISAAWVGVIVAALVLVLLLVFILQNTKSVKISFFTANGTMPLGVALLLAAIGGVLFAGGVASLRIWQLRHRTPAVWRLRRGRPAQPVVGRKG